MGIRAASPTPLELPLSNRTWFKYPSSDSTRPCSLFTTNINRTNTNIAGTQEGIMIRAVFEDCVEIASLSVFVTMIAVWALA